MFIVHLASKTWMKNNIQGAQKNAKECLTVHALSDFPNILLREVGIGLQKTKATCY
jgi:hypothetical protein